MAGFFKMSYDIREIEREFDTLDSLAQKAVVNALNVVGRLINKEIKKFIKSSYNIKARSIARRVSIKSADARKGKAGGVFTIFIKKVGRGLGLYSPTQGGGKGKRKGRVSVKVGRSRKTLAHGAFISTWAKGSVSGSSFMKGPTVFRKATGKNAGTVTLTTRKGTPYKAAKREMLFGPNVADLYSSMKARDILDRTIEDNYQKVLNEKFEKQFEKKR